MAGECSRRWRDLSSSMREEVNQFLERARQYGEELPSAGPLFRSQERGAASDMGLASSTTSLDAQLGDFNRRETGGKRLNSTALELEREPVILSDGELGLPARSRWLPQDGIISHGSSALRHPVPLTRAANELGLRVACSSSDAETVEINGRNLEGKFLKKDGFVDLRDGKWIRTQLFSIHDVILRFLEDGAREQAHSGIPAPATRAVRNPRTSLDGEIIDLSDSKEDEGEYSNQREMLELSAPFIFIREGINDIDHPIVLSSDDDSSEELKQNPVDPRSDLEMATEPVLVRSPIDFFKQSVRNRGAPTDGKADRRCQIWSCRMPATYGHSTGPSRCSQHREAWMVMFDHCLEDGCEKFGVVNLPQAGPVRCEDHSCSERRRLGFRPMSTAPHQHSKDYHGGGEDLLLRLGLRAQVQGCPKKKSVDCSNAGIIVIEDDSSQLPSEVVSGGGVPNDRSGYGVRSDTSLNPHEGALQSLSVHRPLMDKYSADDSLALRLGSRNGDGDCLPGDPTAFVNSEVIAVGRGSSQTHTRMVSGVRVADARAGYGDRTAKSVNPRANDGTPVSLALLQIPNDDHVAGGSRVLEIGLRARVDDFLAQEIARERRQIGQSTSGSVAIAGGTSQPQTAAVRSGDASSRSGYGALDDASLAPKVHNDLIMNGARNSSKVGDGSRLAAATNVRNIDTAPPELSSVNRNDGGARRRLPRSPQQSRAADDCNVNPSPLLEVSHITGGDGSGNVEQRFSEGPARATDSHVARHEMSNALRREADCSREMENKNGEAQILGLRAINNHITPQNPSSIGVGESSRDVKDQELRGDAKILALQASNDEPTPLHTSTAAEEENSRDMGDEELQEDVRILGLHPSSNDRNTSSVADGDSSRNVRDQEKLGHAQIILGTNSTINRFTPNKIPSGVAEESSKDVKDHVLGTAAETRVDHIDSSNNVPDNARSLEVAGSSKDLRDQELEMREPAEICRGENSSNDHFDSNDTPTSPAGEGSSPKHDCEPRKSHETYIFPDAGNNHVDTKNITLILPTGESTKNLELEGVADNALPTGERTKNLELERAADNALSLPTGESTKNLELEGAADTRRGVSRRSKNHLNPSNRPNSWAGRRSKNPHHLQLRGGAAVTLTGTKNHPNPHKRPSYSTLELERSKNHEVRGAAQTSTGVTTTKNHPNPHNGQSFSARESSKNPHHQELRGGAETRTGVTTIQNHQNSLNRQGFSSGESSRNLHSHELKGGGAVETSTGVTTRKTHPNPTPSFSAGENSKHLEDQHLRGGDVEVCATRNTAITSIIPKQHSGISCENQVSALEHEDKTMKELGGHTCKAEEDPERVGNKSGGVHSSARNQLQVHMERTRAKTRASAVHSRTPTPFQAHMERSDAKSGSTTLLKNSNVHGNINTPQEVVHAGASSRVNLITIGAVGAVSSKKHDLALQATNNSFNVHGFMGSPTAGLEIEAKIRTLAQQYGNIREKMVEIDTKIARLQSLEKTSLESHVRETQATISVNSESHVRKTPSTISVNSMPVAKRRALPSPASQAKERAKDPPPSDEDGFMIFPVDGYSWLNYGEMVMAGTDRKNLYYGCVVVGCSARKVEGTTTDGKLMHYYEGSHNHK